ncbi:DEAD/DEAH box helicase [Streptococcus pacificus]|uniref:DEAD/DEAH box helicase n=1 Tax=Streptococcus pacificus TaxID=2740577 RepID=A0ABS0ZKM9_9STRE|nr:DEAD/DEAH box helicase [Streptococcus pacificus]MBJ8326101.1 DEAD/DEAH box helicase [Streptococcus pacificus]
MGRLIPSRIRTEGVSLYEQGALTILENTDKAITARIEDETIVFSYDEAMIKCSCQLFAQKNYCQHLAAIEYFLKNDKKGKVLSESIHTEEPTVPVSTSFGSLFLDNLSFDEDDELKYRLFAEGMKSPYSSDFWWTLKINRLPDEKSYVIRDIKAFLMTIRKESYFQIGKNYFEPLHLSQFDANSQELIQFLWRLIPHKERVDLSYLLPNQGRHLSFPAGFFEEGVSLLTQLTHFSFEMAHQKFQTLIFRELSSQDHLFHFKVIVHRQTIELIVTEKNSQAFFDSRYIFYQGVFYHLDNKQRKLFLAIKNLPIENDLSKHIHFDISEQAKLAASLLEFKEIGDVDAPKSFAIKDFDVYFDFDLSLHNDVLLNMTFDYGNLKISSQEELNNLPFTSHFKKEEKVIKLLRSEDFTVGFSSQRKSLEKEELYAFFEGTLKRFEAIGTVRLSERLSQLKQVEKPSVTIHTTGNLLDISFDFSTIAKGDIKKALEALVNKEDYIISQSGQLILFDDDTQKVSQVLKQLRAKESLDGHFQLNKLAAFHLSDLFKNSKTVSFSKAFEDLSRNLRFPEQFEIKKPDIKTSLRTYQLTGVKWMSMLDSYGFGGVLADDMGLGKTIQTIAFLKNQLSKSSKVLILSPSGLIYNWKDEFEKFAPDLDVGVAYGLKDYRSQLINDNHQILITSYHSFRQDFEEYQSQHYDYLILDEAQMIKNTQTKIAQKLRHFNVGNCFALSGTPIENKLLEIWSIFQIVLPGLLPNKKQFLKLTPDEVSRYIKPFIMRRKKEDVLPELPDLIEMTYSNELADSQKAIYLAQLESMKNHLKGADDRDINRRKIEILSGITRLRQICDTPQLFMDYSGPSGKIESLRELLLQIKENGHRTLIFSQFRGMLDIVEKELVTLGLSNYKITGSTPAHERQEMTRAFNKGSKDSFLISLKAGGVGLNLTGADTVILIDLWWNPAVEMQAISRAHRIGQKEKVEVYRLITKGTIEEKILSLQDSKKHLVTTVLDGNETRSSMSVEDIKEILGIDDENEKIKQLQ